MSRSSVFELNNALGLEDQPIENGLNLISVNQLKAWEKCKAKYKLDYIEELYWPTDQRNFEFGQDVHKLMDYHAKGFDCSTVLKQSSGKVKTAYNLLLKTPITNQAIIASEWGFQVPVPGLENYWLAGRVDRISQNGEHIEVVDWKTGTAVPKNPKEAWQTQLYLYCVYQTRHEFGLADLTPEQFSFVYVEVKDSVRRIDVPYSQAFHDAIEERIVSTLSVIQAEQTFALPNRCPDRYCPYRKVCGIEDLEYQDA